MTSKTPSKKPPTQVASVQGFSAFEAKPKEPLRIDWQRLIGLPPFQMFAIERIGKPHDAIMGWLPEWMSQQDPMDLYNDYCQWHREKGYWPNESPMGELISADGDTLTA